MNGHQGPKDGQGAASYWKDLASMGEDSKDEAGPGPGCLLVATVAFGYKCSDVGAVCLSGSKPRCTGAAA